MTPTPKSASGATARHAVEPGKPQEAAGPFVLNLTSSTTPMALSNPEQPELKRFSFFVSRRFEEGRERFRLHMGYFNTLAEAEEWLGAVRDIYPGAWAGEAPGKKLRERAVAAAAAQAQHAAGPPPMRASAPVPKSVPSANIPTVSAAPPLATSPPTVLAPSASPLAASPLAVAPIAAPSLTAPSLAPPSALPANVPPLNVPTVHAATPVPANIAVARPAPPTVRATGSQSSVTAATASASAAPASAIASSSRAAAPAAPGPAPTKAPSVIGMMRAPKPADPTTVAQKPASAAPKALRATSASAPATPSHGRSAVPVAAPAPAGAAIPVARLSSDKQVPATVAAAPAVTPVAARSTAASAKPTQPAKPTAAPANARPQAASARAPNSKANKSSLPNSNVREVLKALDEAPGEEEITGETRLMPAPLLAGLDAALDDGNLTDTQVLKFLETRRADGTEISGVDIETGAISLLKPDDTGTRRALKEAITVNAPVWFAVQLQWSVQPVELTKVPPLAIFSAYTLYTVEGSRDGRKWYGLRLGFFSDAISAKQVAYYVRSEFASVAVVPVSPQERTRASDSEKNSDLSFEKKTRSTPVDEFKLIDAEESGQAAAQRPGQAATKPAGPARSTPPAAKRAAKSGNRVRAREARTPQTLEETLEILGAGELEMDNGNGETLNDSGVRHLRVEVQKNTPFGRLLERLSERVRKP